MRKQLSLMEAPEMKLFLLQWHLHKIMKPHTTNELGKLKRRFPLMLIFPLKVNSV